MPYTEEELISRIKEIKDKDMREQLLEIIDRGQPVFINITEVKYKIQKGYDSYISGAKIVTTEDSRLVLNSIKKDLMIYKDVCRFIVRDNVIDMMLPNNATLYSYYFLDTLVMSEVLKELPKFNIDIVRP